MSTSEPDFWAHIGHDDRAVSHVAALPVGAGASMHHDHQPNHQPNHQHNHQHADEQHPGRQDSATDEAPRPRKQEQEDATTDITEVAPGILRSELPISMPGLGHVNCYLLEDERGVAVVDPGLPGDESWVHLVDRLGRAGFGVDNVHTVIVTHSHPDHFGGAMRLRHESGADIVTHESFRTIFDGADLDEHEDSERLDVNSPDDRAAAIDRYFDQPTPWGGRRAKPPPEFFERMRTASAGSGPSFFATPQPTVTLADAQTISLGRREWVAMHTPGHTYDHLCLYDPEFGVVLTGDHVLPTITPHISGLAPQPDPLALFFTSLERMTELDDVSIALPAHGRPFGDLGSRAMDIIEHHEGRLDIIRDAQPDLPDATVNEVMRVLFRERSWGEMAESETYAHLEHLRELGELERRTADDGVARYSPVG